MRRIIPGIAFLVCTTNVFAQFALQSGDLLFHVGKGSALGEAIAQVTSGAGNVNYTHVGIVSVEDGNVFVIEATTPSVRKVAVDTFLNDARKINGLPMVAVGRLQSKYHGIIPQAIKNAGTYIGKPYDYVFSPDNDAYYCSELVQLSFKDKRGKPVFTTRKMTFKDDTGRTPRAWEEHFAEHNAPVPEGRPGTNPGDLSKSKEITIVYRYFDSAVPAWPLPGQQDGGE
ncbi:MAG: hypothetical protein LBT49_04865 [Prevotellaceae bacterium]|jgi:hypothetical protein|nr:hypothetical protein [Prevotellaceae bacterium]